MDPVLKFMSESPFLTFFLAVIILQSIIAVVQAIASRNRPTCSCKQLSLGDGDSK
jgi:Na+/citrate or Na+/malate symporter